MKRIVLLLSMITLLFLLVTDADACRRCGRKKCRFIRPTPIVKQIVVAPVQPQTIILQNNYPASLAQVGSSAFGYGAANVLSTNFAPIDVNLFANLQSRIISQGLENISSLQAEGILATNILADTFGRAALVNSATQQLAVALGTNTAPPSTSIELQFDGQAWRVRDLSNTPSPQNEDVPQLPGLTTFSQKCISCHNKVDNPDLSTIDDTLLRKSLHRMRLPVGQEGHMPKEGELTKQEQGQIVKELLDYIMSVSGETN